MSSSALEQVNEYKASVKKQAEKMVTEQFPHRILTCNKHLESEPFLLADLSALHDALEILVPEPEILNNHDGRPSKKRKAEEQQNDVNGSKVMVLPSGCVPINKHISHMVQIIKPIIQNLVEESNMLKMWVSFLIPKIEDGNNFGVGIQEETLSEIRTVESEAGTFFDHISRYYMMRAKIVSKVAKYPHINDYRRSVEELDEKQYLSLRITLSEVRNHYASLHDMITKNMEKIKKPRSVNTHEAMY